VKEAREITVRVLDGMGNVLSDTYREVTFTNQDTTVPYSQSSYDYFYYGKNDLQLWAVDGVYDIYIDIYGYTYMKSSYKVNGKDTQLDIQLPVYRVEAKASNLGYSISEMDWYNEDEQMCASGNIMYLPVGVHKLHGARAQAIRRFDMEINCTVKACAVNNVIATVKEEEKIYGTIEVDNPLKIKVGAAMECYAFTPTETATYKFYTYNSSYTYTLGKLYNSSLYSIASSSTYNNGHFTFSKQCEAGKTYYIGVYASSDYVGRQVELRVEKEE